jgi:hypothetical protein
VKSIEETAAKCRRIANQDGPDLPSTAVSDTLRRAIGALLLEAGWIQSLVDRQPAAAIAPGYTLSGWDIGRLGWVLQNLTEGLSNMRRLSPEMAQIGADPNRFQEQLRRLVDVVDVADIALAEFRDVIDKIGT